MTNKEDKKENKDIIIMKEIIEAWKEDKRILYYIISSPKDIIIGGVKYGYITLLKLIIESKIGSDYNKIDIITNHKDIRGEYYDLIIVEEFRKLPERIKREIREGLIMPSLSRFQGRCIWKSREVRRWNQ